MENETTYPHLAKDVIITILEKFGWVEDVNLKRKTKISRESVELLALCNGTNSFEEVIEEYSKSNFIKNEAEAYGAVLNLLHFVEHNILLLNRVTNNKNHVIRLDKLTYPEAMHIELTSICNLNCFYCYRDAGSNVIENRLSTEKLLQIIDELIYRGLTLVELTGGEPMAHPDFLKIFEFCAERLELVTIITNGTLLKEKHIKRFLPYKNKIAFSISLDSYLPEEHDKRSGKKGSHKSVLEGIKLLGKYDFLTRVSMAVDENNWTHVEKTLLLAKKLGAKKFGYSPIIPFGRGENGYKFWNKDYKEVLEHEKYLQENYYDFLHVVIEDDKSELFTPGSCGAGSRACAMDPEGNVRICATFDADKGIIGSLVKQTPEEIFNSSVSKLSKEIVAPSIEICKSCEYVSFCLGCTLRGYKGSQWIGKDNCKWMKEEGVKEWSLLIEG